MQGWGLPQNAGGLLGPGGVLEAEMCLLYSPRAGGEGRKVSTIYLPTYFGLGFKRVFKHFQLNLVVPASIHFLLGEVVRLSVGFRDRGEAVGQFCSPVSKSETDPLTVLHMVALARAVGGLLPRAGSGLRWGSSCHPYPSPRESQEQLFPTWAPTAPTGSQGHSCRLLPMPGAAGSPHGREWGQALLTLMLGRCDPGSPA